MPIAEAYRDVTKMIPRKWSKTTLANYKISHYPNLPKDIKKSHKLTESLCFPTTPKILKYLHKIK